MLSTKNLIMVSQLFCVTALFCSCSGADSKTPAKNNNSNDSTKTIAAEEKDLFKPGDSAKYFELQKY